MRRITRVPAVAALPLISASASQHWMSARSAERSRRSMPTSCTNLNPSACDDDTAASYPAERTNSSRARREAESGSTIRMLWRFRGKFATSKLGISGQVFVRLRLLVPYRHQVSWIHENNPDPLLMHAAG